MNLRKGIKRWIPLLCFSLSFVTNALAGGAAPFGKEAGQPWQRGSDSARTCLVTVLVKKKLIERPVQAGDRVDIVCSLRDTKRGGQVVHVTVLKLEVTRIEREDAETLVLIIRGTSEECQLLRIGATDGQIRILPPPRPPRPTDRAVIEMLPQESKR